jgi:hypothetical protein
MGFSKEAVDNMTQMMCSMRLITVVRRDTSMKHIFVLLVTWMMHTYVPTYTVYICRYVPVQGCMLHHTVLREGGRNAGEFQNVGALSVT